MTYLTARKAHYAHQDRWTTEYRQAAERCLAQFTGLFVKSNTEAPSPRLPLLSLYFLMPRPAVAVFSPGLPATHRDRVGPAAAQRSLAAL